MAGRWKLIAVLALTVLTVAVYGPVRHHAFTNFDDPTYLTSNPEVQRGLTASGLAWAFFNLHGVGTYWHPLTWVSHMVDCQLFGLNPGPHHLVNVALHLANTLLLLWLLLRLTGAWWRSLVVAALFALHPLQVESVAWAAERKNVLSTLFWLLTLLAYVRYARAPKLGRYLLVLFCFGLGLMCKPALVTLPLVMLLLDYWPLGRWPKAEREGPQAETERAVSSSRTWLLLLTEKLPLLVLAATASLITIAAHRELGADWSYRIPWPWRIENALVSYVRYIGKIFWPVDLVVFYTHPGGWPVWAFGGSALILLAISAGVIWRSRRSPYLVTGWFWFLITLLPMIGIIQAGGQAMADRFAYIPMMGLLVMVVWGMGELLQSPVVRREPVEPAQPFSLSDGAAGPPGIANAAGVARLTPARRAMAASAVAAALAACAWLTARQVATWQDSLTLFGHALRVDPNNACAQYSLGSELADRGQVEEALQRWEKALEIEPWWANTHGKIAGVLYQRGDYPGAMARYRRALEIDPAQNEVLNNLAWLRATCPDASLRDGAEAVRLAQKACEVTRFHKTVMVGTLAAAYAEAGQFAEAVATAQQACDLAAARGESALLKRNQELLERYQAGQPFHEVR